MISQCQNLPNHACLPLAYLPNTDYQTVAELRGLASLAFLGGIVCAIPLAERHHRSHFLPGPILMGCDVGSGTDGAKLHTHCVPLYTTFRLKIHYICV